MTQEVDHYANFMFFSKLHLDTGCPDPHLKLAVEGMLEMDDLVERAWRAICYVSPYEVCTGSQIWEEWPYSRVAVDHEGFAAWLEETWPRWNIRRERRAARTVKKMTESMMSAHAWIPELMVYRHAEYELLWLKADNSLKYFGRYALIKLLEALWRGGVVNQAIPDIRPAGGWSPRETLALIDPTFIDSGSNKPSYLNMVDSHALQMKNAIEHFLGNYVSWYDMEVLLCNYRQFPQHHPGWPLDSDLKYYHQFREKWGHEPPLRFESYRSHLFPEQVLGEVQGWDGPRDDIEDTWPRYGYHWSDMVYDYNKSKNDLANPVRRS